MEHWKGCLHCLLVLLICLLPCFGSDETISFMLKTHKKIIITITKGSYFIIITYHHSRRRPCPNAPWHGSAFSVLSTREKLLALGLTAIMLLATSHLSMLCSRWRRDLRAVGCQAFAGLVNVCLVGTAYDPICIMNNILFNKIRTRLVEGVKPPDATASDQRQLLS